MSIIRILNISWNNKNENNAVLGGSNYYTVDVNYTDDCVSYRWSLHDHANVRQERHGL